MEYPETLPFTTDGAYEAIDGLATQACVRDGVAEWMLTFRLGLRAWGWRLYGVAVHYRDVHSWSRLRSAVGDEEYHMASMLFNMDSALECLVFALNALGHAEEPALFANISDPKALRKLDVRAVTGEQALAGFEKYYPSFTQLWRGSTDTITTIIDQHDVSKHRMALATGGNFRLDPPPGLPKMEGSIGSGLFYATHAPYAKLFLRDPAKEPLPLRQAREDKGAIVLEELCLRFVRLMNASATCLPADIATTFKLNDALADSSGAGA